MIFALFVILFVLGFGCFWIERRWAGILLTLLAALILGVVGTGALPRVLLEDLQIYPRVNPQGWQGQHVIVVLGAGQISWPLPAKPSGTLFSEARVLEAVRLYRSCATQSNACKVLVSGGDPAHLGVSEAEIMRDQLVELGVGQDVIQVEKESLNTFQNAKFSAQLIPKDAVVLLVTSLWHMRRSVLYFSRFGVRVIPAPSDRLAVAPEVFPSAYHFFLADLAVHEIFGRVQLSFYDLVGWNG